MNNKEIHIEIPNGMMLDEEKYKNNIIAFLPKPVDPLAHLPKSWEELKTVSGFYIDGDDAVIIPASEVICVNTCKDIVPTESQAKAILALCQLLQLRDRFNDGDQLVMTGRDERYCIWNACSKIKTITYTPTNCILKFKTRELRDHFLTHHRALIEEAKELL